MQKIINVIAISSGVVSLTVIIGGVSLYANRGKIIDNVKSQVMEQVSGALGGAINSSIPDVTGGVTDTPIGLPSL